MNCIGRKDGSQRQAESYIFMNSMSGVIITRVIWLALPTPTIPIFHSPLARRARR
jgi:hypothetical protein